MLFDEEEKKEILEHLERVETLLKVMKDPSDLIGQIYQILKHLPLDVQSIILFEGALVAAKSSKDPIDLLNKYHLKIYGELKVAEHERDKP